jgi:hypothetical protein
MVGKNRHAGLSGLAGFVLGAAILGFAPSARSNPDEGSLEGRFVRGDTNNDGRQDLSDAVFLLRALFDGGPPPPCDEVADINDDELWDLSDAVFMLRHLFMSEASPPAPYPECDYDPHGALCQKSLCNPAA